MDYTTFEDVTASLTTFIEDMQCQRRHSALGYKSPITFEEEDARHDRLTIASPVQPQGVHSNPGSDSSRR